MKLVEMCTSNGSVKKKSRMVFAVSVLILASAACILEGVGAQAVDNSNSKINAVANNGVRDRSAHLMESSLLFGVLSEFVSSEGDQSRCRSDVQVILDGIRMRSVWALKILDTGPHVPSAFVFGNNFWFTASSLCAYLNEPVHITHSANIPKKMGPQLLNSTSPVRLKHRMVYANFTSPMQIDIKFHVNPIVQIGLCVPESCEDAVLITTVQSYLNDVPLPMLDLFELNMTVISTKSLDYDSTLFTTTAFYLLCLVLLFVIITATLAKRQQTDHRSAGSAEKDIVPSFEIPSTYSRFVNCFDMAANYRSIFAENASKGVSAIDGIKTIACIWVLIFHVSYHSAFAVENTPQLVIKMEWFIYQPIFQAYLYVDSFFVISGILLVYNFMRNETKQKRICSNSTWANIKYFTEHVVHRYIRLTPMLIVIMLLSELLYTYLEHYTPFWVDESNDLDCRETWWLNMLFIQNFLSLNAMCSSWTWYLACDTQYYILGLIMLFLYTKYSRSVTTVFFLLTAAMLGSSFYFSYAYDLTYEIDVLESNSGWLYTKPWMRMNPFLGGAFIGWLLHRLVVDKITFRRSLVWMYWSVASLVFLFTIFMTYKRDMLPIWCALLLSFGKLIFGLYIGSIVVMCHLGYGDVLSKIFNHSLLRHLSKLTFSMYMVSPMVVTLANGIKEVSTHFDEATTAVNIIASSAVSYVLAIGFSVLFELPFQKLSDEFVLKRKKTTVPKI